MSIYTKYAESVRQAHAEWAQGFDSAAQNAQEYVSQARESVVKPEQITDAFDYLERAIATQAQVTKRLAAASSTFATEVLSQLEAGAKAAREYASDTQEVLAEQANRHYADYVRTVERLTQAKGAAVTAASSVVAPVDAVPTTQPAKPAKKRSTAGTAA